MLRNLFEEVGWQHKLLADPDLLREELVELRRLVAAWELLDASSPNAHPPLGWLRRSIGLLLGRGPKPLLTPTEATGAPPHRSASRPDTSDTAAA